jgi:hypothetical protein
MSKRISKTTVRLTNLDLIFVKKRDLQNRWDFIPDHIFMKRHISNEKDVSNSIRD